MPKITTESNRPGSHLVYASGPEGEFRLPYLRTGEGRLENDVFDSELISVSQDLANTLGSTYAAAFLEKLKDRDYPDPVPHKMGRVLADRAWHEPRVSLYSADELNETVVEDEGVDHARQGSVVVNFRLPLPLEAFWHKSILHPPDSSEEIASGWGSRYYALMDTPWKTIHQWQQQHPEFVLRRLNGPGIHKDGSGGYYYLIEVSRAA